MNASALSDALLDLIQRQPNAEKAVTYLTEQADAYRKTPTQALFYRVFTALPRFVGKQTLTVPPATISEIQDLRNGFVVEGWSLDRLARVWWLLQLPAEDQAAYTSTIENLFKAAEMNELVALYSALPVLRFPEHWRFLATEAVRSNIGPVQEALMLHNPYPAEQLDEPAWNQLIMKAFFSDKAVEQIAGFEERTNERLARIATDYARERRAAGRTVHPELWTLVKPFVTEGNRAELEELFGTHGPAGVSA
ncbi:EboA domain-containing protein [Larkinella insperata]|uniref:EboA domain-containing protein n=1 Tax=Larkinella insperata TaxID=332158 RepID=A0ABW3QFY6_9BACT|nr:EboA domain-containing protein [Larkinella insperata]